MELSYFNNLREEDVMRVLILSATTGGGHMRAANALKDYIMKQEPDSVVKIEDTIEYASPLLNKTVTGGYVYMATKTPKMYGSFYKSIDKERTMNKTVEMVVAQFRKKFIPLIDEFRPDIIVTTHSIGTEMAASLKKKENIHVPVLSIITDFAVHQTYISDGVDAYILSSYEMISQMVERGVDRVQLYPYGIPVKQSFFEKIDREKAFAEEEMNPDVPVILIMAGSFGVTDILKIYHKIVKSPVDFQVIVITGKNEKLYETFDKYLSKLTLNNTWFDFDIEKPVNFKSSIRMSRHKKPSKPTKLLYYTNEVEKYMQMSDIIVTKPGGLTVSEAIATGLPMGIFKAIPGQEEQNADYLVREGMAVRLSKNNECTQVITDLMSHPEKLAAMRQAIKDSARGNSAANIYLLMCDLVKKYKKNSN